MFGHPDHQYFIFSRNIGRVTPKIIYFHYLIKILDQSIQNILDWILKTETLLTTSRFPNNLNSKMTSSLAAKPFSKLNYYFFGYFDPKNKYFDNKNKQFSG